MFCYRWIDKRPPGQRGGPCTIRVWIFHCQPSRGSKLQQWAPCSRRKTFITSPSQALAGQYKLWAPQANDLESIHLSWPFPPAWDATENVRLAFFFPLFFSFSFLSRRDIQGMQAIWKLLSFTSLAGAQHWDPSGKQDWGVIGLGILGGQRDITALPPLPDCFTLAHRLFLH